MSDQQSSSKPSCVQTSMPPKHRRRRMIRRIVLLVLLIPVLLVALGLWLLRSEPEHWKQYQSFLTTTSPAQRQAIAQSAKAQISELANLDLEALVGEAAIAAPLAADSSHAQVTGAGEMPTAIGSEQRGGKTSPSDVRIDTIRRLHLDQDQINALIQTELDTWMASRGYEMPAEIDQPMIALDGQQLIMAFQYSTPGFSQVISAYFNLTFLPSGMALLSLDQFEAGRLPVPVDSIGQWLAEQSGGDEQAQKIGEWLGELEHLEFKPVLELEHRRRARIEGYAIGPDGVELVMRVQDHRTYKQMNQKLAAVASP